MAKVVGFKQWTCDQRNRYQNSRHLQDHFELTSSAKLMSRRLTNRKMKTKFNYDSPVRLRAQYEPAFRSPSSQVSKSITKTCSNLVSVALGALVVAAVIATVSCDISDKPQSQHAYNQNQGKSQSTNNQRERFLSSLAESIERKHLGLSPVRALAAITPQRPSKFDTGEEFYEIPLGLDPAASSQKKIAPVKKKNDEGMRDILMMHEMAAKSSPTRQDASPSTTSRPKLNLLHPKIINHIATYVAPLVGSKVLDPGILDKSFGLTSNTSDGRQGFHRFIPRSNNGPVTIVNLGLNLVGKRLTGSESPQYRPITKAPATSYLVKPNSGKSDIHQYVPTQPSVSFSGGSSLNQEIDNLLTSDTVNSISVASNQAELSAPKEKPAAQGSAGSWIKSSANQFAQSYLQDSLRALLTMSQLPILSANPISTAPSVYERAGKKKKVAPSTSGSAATSDKPPSLTRPGNSQATNIRLKAMEELYRYAYILGSGVRRKRDPLKALSSASRPAATLTNRGRNIFGQRSTNQQVANPEGLNMAKSALNSILTSKRARPRGVMWEMATDPSLAVTVFHLLERASVALPLGFLLMPFVKMVGSPASTFNLASMLPARASHRSVDYEELAKRLDVVDKMLSKALRPTHRAA